MIYVCPLCAKQYLIKCSDGVYGSAEFSEDHLPPESVGGKFKVLTCKKCNNDAGHFEAELIKLLDFGSVPDKRGSLFPDARISNPITGESYRIAVKKTLNTASLEFHEAAKQHNPKLKAFIEKLHTKDFPKLNLLVGCHNEQKLAQAILKSSYLLGFVNWGYEFVYSTYGEWIREAFQGIRTYPVRVPVRWESALNNTVRKGISIIRLNGKKEAFLMSLKLTSNSESVIAATLFPNPSLMGWEELTKLNAIVESKNPIKLQATTIPRSVGRKGYTTAWSLI